MLKRLDIKFFIGKIFICAGMVFAFTPFIVGQDSIHESSLSLKGYVKTMQTAIFANIRDPWITSNLIHNRLNLKWYPTGSISIGLEARNRFLYGDFLSLVPEAMTGFGEDDGFMQLSRNLAEGSSFVLNSSIDRLMIDYTFGNTQVTLGRQRINWSETFVWNPNDIFNAYNYFDFDYEEKPGSDALRVQYYTSPSDKIEFAGKLDDEKNITAAALWRMNRWNYDFKALAGVMNSDDYVLGIGWSGQIARGGFRGECSYFRPIDNFSDTSGALVASFGYDYAFENSLFLQAEILYNGNSEQIIDSVLSLFGSFRLSAKNPFLDGFSAFAGVTYPFTPLFSGSVAVIGNPDKKLLILIPSLEYSLAQNLDFSLVAQHLPAIRNSGNTAISLVFLRFRYNF